MKRITAIILLICLSLTILGYHFVFHYQIALAKAEMKKELLSRQHDNDMVRFEFTPEQLNTLEWENQHEFRFQGNMYDVVEKSFLNGKTVLRCVSDEKETALIEYYLKVNRENHTGDRRIAGMLELSVTPFLPVQVALLTSPVKFKLSNSFTTYNAHIPERFQRVITPPPEVC